LGGDAPRQENVNDGLGFGCAGGGLGLQLEEIAQRQSQAANQAHKKKLAPIGVVPMFGAIAEGIVAFSHIQFSFKWPDALPP
jgi:hypothetical protein